MTPTPAVSPSSSNVPLVPDYEGYLVADRRTLATRYLCVERDLAQRKLEYAQVLCDEKRAKSSAYARSIQQGSSPSAADRAADYSTVHFITESITLRIEVDVLEREAAMLLFILRAGDYSGANY